MKDSPLDAGSLGAQLARQHGAADLPVLASLLPLKQRMVTWSVVFFLKSVNVRERVRVIKTTVLVMVKLMESLTAGRFPSLCFLLHGQAMLPS